MRARPALLLLSTHHLQGRVILPLAGCSEEEEKFLAVHAGSDRIINSFRGWEFKDIPFLK